MTWLRARLTTPSDRQDSSPAFFHVHCGNQFQVTPGEPLAHQKWLGNSREFLVRTKSKRLFSAPRNSKKSCTEPSYTLSLWVRATRRWGFRAKCCLLLIRVSRPTANLGVASQVMFFRHPRARTGWLLTVTVHINCDLRLSLSSFQFWAPYPVLHVLIPWNLTATSPVIAVNPTGQTRKRGLKGLSHLADFLRKRELGPKLESAVPPRAERTGPSTSERSPRDT